MSRPPLCSAQAAKYDSVLDVEQTFAAIFCTLKHDFVELQQLSSYDQMLSTIRELNLSPDQHNTSTYDTRINGVAMAVGAFVAYLERVVGASGIESCPNWQAMLWGSMTILLKVWSSVSIVSLCSRTERRTGTSHPGLLRRTSSPFD